MGKKADATGAINLDSFLDVLTCLQGILMLVIIATGIDAAQTKVLVPTPIERQSDKQAVYLECRGNRIYPMDVPELARQARIQMMAVSQQAGGDQIKLMQALGNQHVTNEFYEVDLTYYLLGQLVINPRQDAPKGYELQELSTFSSDNFMVHLLNSFDSEKKRIVLIVRDDSFQVFKVAQRLSFLKQAEVGVEIYDAREVLRFSQQGVLLSSS